MSALYVSLQIVMRELMHLHLAIHELMDFARSFSATRQWQHFQKLESQSMMRAHKTPERWCQMASACHCPVASRMVPTPGSQKRNHAHTSGKSDMMARKLLYILPRGDV